MYSTMENCCCLTRKQLLQKPQCFKYRNAMFSLGRYANHKSLRPYLRYVTLVKASALHLHRYSLNARHYP